MAEKTSKKGVKASPKKGAMQKPGKATPILFDKKKPGGAGPKPMQKPGKATPILFDKDKPGEADPKPMQKPGKATPILFDKNKPGGEGGPKPMQKPGKATPILFDKDKPGEAGPKPMQKPGKATPILFDKNKPGGEGGPKPMQKPGKATPILFDKNKPGEVDPKPPRPSATVGRESSGAVKAPKSRAPRRGKKKEEEPAAAEPMQKPGKATPILFDKDKPAAPAPAQAPSSRRTPREPDETTEPFGAPFAETPPPPAAAAPAEPATAPGKPRKVDVTAFPRKARPPEPPPAPAAKPAAEVEKPPPAPARAPKAARPPEPAPSPARPPAPERARPPAEPAPRWVEASDVLVEGFFLTPEPRFRQTTAEPIGEGFFVARVAGEEAARRHGLTDRPGAVPPGALDEDLGELPVSYGDDDVLALPRDPHSLFFFWDFKSAQVQGSRAVLRVYDGDQLVRELELESEQRSFYLHDLPAGRTYRLEAHLVDPSGATRMVGQAKLVSLPGEGPVRTTEVRFLKLPWHLALAKLREYLKEGGAQVEVVQGKESFTAWIRTPLPSSADVQEAIATEREAAAKVGEGLESLGNWRPSPSGQSWSK